MTVWLYDLDGKMPNLALMRIAAHFRLCGKDVSIRRAGDIEPVMFEDEPERVFASLLFSKTRPVAEALLRRFPSAIVGGTGWDLATTLEDIGIPNHRPDYSIYPGWAISSVGFTQRGCRRRCAFCVVPEKEGRNRSVATLADIWRGEPYPRDLMLLDNDFFGQPAWRDRITETAEGKYRVCISQGINARNLTEEQAEALAALDPMDNEFKSRRVYTAWDNVKDKRAFFRGLGLLLRNFEPRRIMVYVLVGFEPGEDHEAREQRVRPLLDAGVLPYIMPYRDTRELLGYQRWVHYGYWRNMPWPDWVRDGYQAHAEHRRRAVSGEPEFAI